MKGKSINITWAWDKGKTWDLMRSPGIEPMTSQTPRTPGTHVAFPFQKTDSKGLSNEQLCKLSKVYLMLLFHWCYSRKCLVFNRLGVACLQCTLLFFVLSLYGQRSQSVVYRRQFLVDNDVQYLSRIWIYLVFISPDSCIAVRVFWKCHNMQWHHISHQQKPQLVIWNKTVFLQRFPLDFIVRA